MKMKNLLLVVAVLAGSLLSNSVLAACNVNIQITKPNEIYVDNLDGTVSDSETGLMWQKCTLGQSWSPAVDLNSGSDDKCGGPAASGTWQVALARANENTDYNYSDWRLPNKNELKSLVEIACYSPAINNDVFPSTIESKYWSSTPYYISNSKGALTTDFKKGLSNQFNKDFRFYIRLVRNHN